MLFYCISLPISLPILLPVFLVVASANLISSYGRKCTVRQSGIQIKLVIQIVYAHEKISEGTKPLANVTFRALKRRELDDGTGQD